MEIATRVLHIAGVNTCANTCEMQNNVHSNTCCSITRTSPHEHECSITRTSPYEHEYVPFRKLVPLLGVTIFIVAVLKHNDPKQSITVGSFTKRNSYRRQHLSSTPNGNGEKTSNITFVVEDRGNVHSDIAIATFDDNASKWNTVNENKVGKYDDGSTFLRNLTASYAKNHGYGYHMSVSSWLVYAYLIFYVCRRLVPIYGCTAQHVQCWWIWHRYTAKNDSIHSA